MQNWLVAILFLETQLSTTIFTLHISVTVPNQVIGDDTSQELAFHVLIDLIWAFVLILKINDLFFQSLFVVVMKYFRYFAVNFNL